MTRDEIIEMARQAWISDKEAQLITEFDMAYISCTYLTDLVTFAKLVAAKEREACAKVCEDNATDLSEGDWDSACINCADHIRARSGEC